MTSAPETAMDIDAQLVTQLQQRILAWYDEHARDLPWRRTRDPYAILVSEVMLQQTQVTRVIPKYEAFLARFPTLEALAAAPLADVLTLWSGLGYNNRAERLRRCALALRDDTAAGEAAGPGGAGGGDPTLPPPLALPRSAARLEHLPGIGPYTARAVMIFAHNADLAAVDANVRRVLIHELRLPRDIGLRETQRVAAAVLPRGRAREWHNALMDYGSAVLTTRATGVPALSRQPAFAGSRRLYRARLVRLLLAESPRSRAAVPAALGLPADEAEQIIAALAHDALLRIEGDAIFLAS
jgi:A/G-specific adenine glycosylase